MTDYSNPLIIYAKKGFFKGRTTWVTNSCREPILKYWNSSWCEEYLPTFEKSNSVEIMIYMMTMYGKYEEDTDSQNKTKYNDALERIKTLSLYINNTYRQQIAFNIPDGEGNLAAPKLGKRLNKLQAERDKEEEEKYNTAIGIMNGTFLVGPSSYGPQTGRGSKYIENGQYLVGALTNFGGYANFVQGLYLQ